MGVRPAEKSDFEFIQNLNQEIFHYEIEHCSPRGWNGEYPFQPAGKAYIRKSIGCEEGYRAFIYEENDEKLAYMILRITPEEELCHRSNISLAQIHTFCVSKNHRGKGIGKKMVEKAKLWAKEQGLNRLNVIATVGNDLSNGFYQSVGFKEFEVTYEMEL